MFVSGDDFLGMAAPLQTLLLIVHVIGKSYYKLLLNVRHGQPDCFSLSQHNISVQSMSPGCSGMKSGQIPNRLLKINRWYSFVFGV